MREYLDDHHKNHILLYIILPPVLSSMKADQLKIEHLNLKFYDYYLQLVEDLAHMITRDIEGEISFLKSAFITINDVYISSRGVSCRAKFKGAYYNLSYDRKLVKQTVDAYLRSKRVTNSTHYSGYIRKLG